jgi:hypothetical protein
MSKTVRRLATATGISYSPPVPIQYVARSVARHTRGLKLETDLRFPFDSQNDVRSVAC